jgi:hypothetical protein
LDHEIPEGEAVEEESETTEAAGENGPQQSRARQQAR